MTPTPECIEAVARAIDKIVGSDWRDMDLEDCSIDVATAAIEAATPHIRQQVFDELIAEAYEDGWDIPSKLVADWLYTQKEASHE